MENSVTYLFDIDSFCTSRPPVPLGKSMYKAWGDIEQTNIWQHVSLYTTETHSIMQITKTNGIK